MPRQQQEQRLVVALELGPYERAAELERWSQVAQERRLIAEQRARIQASEPLACHYIIGGRDAIGAGDHPALLMPHEQVPIVGVELVQVGGTASALSGGAEGPLTQATDLLQRQGRLIRGDVVDVPIAARQQPGPTRKRLDLRGQRLGGNGGGDRFGTASPRSAAQQRTPRGRIGDQAVGAHTQIRRLRRRVADAASRRCDTTRPRLRRTVPPRWRSNSRPSIADRSHGLIRPARTNHSLFWPCTKPATPARRRAPPVAPRRFAIPYRRRARRRRERATLRRPETPPARGQPAATRGRCGRRQRCWRCPARSCRWAPHTRASREFVPAGDCQAASRRGGPC